MEKYGAVAILVALAVFFRSACDVAPYAIYGIIGSIILGVAGILAFILPYKIAGRWTEYGMEYDARWQNFKRFINDFSLIKDTTTRIHSHLEPVPSLCYRSRSGR